MSNVHRRHWIIGAPSAAALGVLALLGGGAAASTAGRATVAAGAAPAGPRCAPPHRGRTRHTLPAAAVGPVSRILGSGQRAYQVTQAGDDLAARNPAQRLAARFGPTGPLIRSGPVAVRMRLAGYGYGTRLSALRPALPVARANQALRAALPVARANQALRAALPVARANQALRPALPVARANQVLYHDGPLTQWYANGPAGLEQGFTLAAPPAHEPSRARPGPLTLALAVSGGARARLTAGGAVFSAAGRSLAYRDLVVSDARGRRLRAWLTLAPGRVLLHADVAGARYPVTIDPVFQQLAELTASDGASGDALGNSVAVSGSTVVAGAPSATVGGGASAGALYVFTEPADGWADESQAAKLTASDAAAGDNLGYSVAIDGATIVAGAYGANSGLGAAYVFTEPGGGWADENQAAELTASDGAAGDALGYSVGISGNTIVAGAVNATVDSHTLQGAAYVFTEPLGGWADENQAAKLTASDGAAGTQFGQSVAISGATVVAGAPFTMVGSNISQGAAYVFTEPLGGWADENQAAKLTASDGATSDMLGSSVAISGSTVVAGAPAAQIVCQPSQGAAYVFTEPLGGWADENQAAKLTASDGATGDSLGWSVGISGNTVVAGAPFATVSANNNQGAAYAFTEPGGGWADETEAAKLTAAGGAAGDELGYAVAVSGATVVTGAPNATVGSNSGQGAGYVFGAPAPPHPPPPAGYRLSGFHTPRAGSTWRAGAVIPVSTQVVYDNGMPVPGWLAAELAAGCEVTVRASGAQRLPSRCLHWNPVTQRLAFRWPTGTRRAGKVALTLRLAYLTPQTLSEPLTITPHHHRTRQP